MKAYAVTFSTIAGPVAGALVNIIHATPRTIWLAETAFAALDAAIKDIAPDTLDELESISCELVGEVSQLQKRARL